MSSADPLEPFSPAVRAWFATTFGAPTAAQAQGWPAIAGGEHTLILAPTGSGKTLASFLWGLDRLVTQPPPDDKTRRTRLVYLSPLRALAVDVEKNLRAPLMGIGLAAERLGLEFHAPTVGMRTGDTAADERRKLVRTPPDLLITTPESLYLMLTSAARDTLRNVEAVIIDEIHALAPTKRGSHLAISLERLEDLCERPPQRIGLSATQRPLDEIARFLGGYHVVDDAPTADPATGPPRRVPRPVTIVDAGIRKPLEVEVVVPIEDMGALGELVDDGADGPAGSPARRSIWPSIHPRLLELVQEHRSTLIFVNARRLAERLATRLNELAADGENRAAEAEGRPPEPGREVVKAHHGSLSRERRLQIEDELKRGELKGLVATSSLELGIDMGAVDLVIQVSSPGAVSRGLQRIGRAGHQVGEPSRGKLFPKHRNDLVESAVVVGRMQAGLIEHTRYPRNPLDVLAQQIVAMCALDEWPVDELSDLVRRAAPYAELSDEVLTNVLDLLAGRYPSDEFAELRPRLVWDRALGQIRGRAGAQRLAVTSGGTIPDRGLYGVFLPDGARVGELDEEMVYESRVGETFLLGASTWRIEDITHERVVVSPAPGQPGKMPFWHGDGPGRPLELGQALGQFVREVRAEGAASLERLQSDNGLDPLAARNLVAYLDEQAESCGGLVPDDRTIVVERFRDEIGDWRVCVLSPFGAQVHAPWGMALQARLAERWGVEVELMWSDDGIVLRLPEAIDELPLDELAIDPDEIEAVVVAQLPQTAMFAARFRECAARALLLPRRRPDRRTPLWQQRQKAADLLAVAANHPDFPILLETTRECINDVFDLPALRQVLTDLRSRRVRMLAVETPRASPFAQSLLFGWIGVYMYEGDAPLAERRAAALALDRDLLRDLLGAEELRELIDPGVLADLELELQRLVEGRRARDPDEVHDLLRVLGPLSRWEIDVRCAAGSESGPAEAWVDQLLVQRRAIRVSIAGDERIAAAEDAARLRDALGVALPPGLPTAFTDSVPDPMVDLVARFARTHGPFLSAQVAQRYGLGLDRVTPALDRLEAAGRIVRGEFRPDGIEREWCDDDVLRQLRRRSLAALRKEVEPVDAAALARFLPEWQGVGAPRRGLDALVEAIGSLQGAALPASTLEADVLSARVAGYQPADLDALCTSGEVVWAGAGPLGPSDGRVRLLFRDQAALLGASGSPADAGSEQLASPLHQVLRTHLAARGVLLLVRSGGSRGRCRRARRRCGRARRPVGSGVGRRGHQRRRGPAAGADRARFGAPIRRLRPGSPVRRCVAPASAARPALPEPRRHDRRRHRSRSEPNRSSGRGRAVGAGGPPAATGPHAHRSRARPGAAVARALRRPDPRGHPGRRRRGRLRRHLPGAQGPGGSGSGAAGVLRGRSGRGSVRRCRVRSTACAPPATSTTVWATAKLPPLVLAATDPAQPYGAALAWPDSAGRPARSAGAFVVSIAGRPMAVLERGAKSLSTFAGVADHPGWAEGLVRLVKDGRLRKLEITRIDGAPAAESVVADHLRAAGFADGYKGLTFRL